LSPLVKPLELSDEEQRDLVAFLESLTSEVASVLAFDARTVRIGERQSRASLDSGATRLTD